jgi:hypothetical protein
MTGAFFVSVSLTEILPNFFSKTVQERLFRQTVDQGFGRRRFAVALSHQDRYIDLELFSQIKEEVRDCLLQAAPMWVENVGWFVFIFWHVL